MKARCDRIIVVWLAQLFLFPMQLFNPHSPRLLVRAVLLTDAPSTAGAAPPLLRPGATTFSANDRNLIDRATNATNTVEFASIASALANLDSDQLPSKEEMGLTVRMFCALKKILATHIVISSQGCKLLYSVFFFGYPIIFRSTSSIS